MQQGSVFDAINFEDSLVGPAVNWLVRHDVDPRRLVDDAMERLRRRNRALPRAQRIQYAMKVLLGEFFARWANKNRGRPVAELWEDPTQRERELHPFALALMAAGDERAFERFAPQFSRRRVIESAGLSAGTPDGFTAFVAENTYTLAALFLKNFDATRPGAALHAVRYLQKTAVSWYLIRRTRPIRTDAPNLDTYLANSKRISKRTVLATKLAYLPALLTDDDRQVLRRQYGFSGPIGRRLPIKDIANRLGFKNASALYRRLYKVRAWCRKSTPPAEEKGVSI